MSYERLRYNPVQIGAGATVQITRTSIGGFLCTTSGTLTVVKHDGDGTTTTIINGLPVTAGNWVDLPFYLPFGGTATSAGGAIGVLAV